MDDKTLLDEARRMQDEVRRERAMSLSIEWNTAFVGRAAIDDDDLLVGARMIESYLRGSHHEPQVDASVLRRALNLLEIAEPNITIGEPDLDAQWRGERLLVTQALRDALGDTDEADEVDV